MYSSGVYDAFFKSFEKITKILHTPSAGLWGLRVLPNYSNLLGDQGLGRCRATLGFSLSTKCNKIFVFFNKNVRCQWFHTMDQDLIRPLHTHTHAHTYSPKKRFLATFMQITATVEVLDPKKVQSSRLPKKSIYNRRS